MARAMLWEILCLKTWAELGAIGSVLFVLYVCFGG